MYYSATPEFLDFTRRYLGRKVTNDFEDVFCGERTSHWGKCGRDVEVEAIDPCVLQKRTYAHCFVRSFARPDGECGALNWRVRRVLEKPNLHLLFVQVEGGRIIRFFPPTIAWAERIQNETFHAMSSGECWQVRSPNEKDFNLYGKILDACTIKGEEYNRLYIDCPIIWDNLHTSRGYDWEHRCFESDWTWEKEFSPKKIAERKQEDDDYYRMQKPPFLCHGHSKD